MFLKKYIQFNISFFTFFIFVSTLFSVSSIFWTTDMAYSLQDKKEIALGFPLRFNVFDHSRWDGNNFNVRPEKVGFMWDCPSTMLWRLFALNVLIVHIFLTTLLFAAQICFPAIVKLLKLCSLKNIILGCFIFLLLVIIWFWTQSMYAKNAPPLSPEMMQSVLFRPIPLEIIQPRPLQQ